MNSTRIHLINNSTRIQHFLAEIEYKRMHARDNFISMFHFCFPSLSALLAHFLKKGKETDLDVSVRFSNETKKFWIEIEHKHCTMIRIRRGAARIPPAG